MPSHIYLSCFSHHALLSLKHLCAGKLDFPPVSVTADKSGNTVTFENPLITYRELNDSRNLKKAFFKFTVSSDQVHFS